MTIKSYGIFVIVAFVIPLFLFATGLVPKAIMWAAWVGLIGPTFYCYALTTWAVQEPVVRAKVFWSSVAGTVILASATLWVSDAELFGAGLIMSMTGILGLLGGLISGGIVLMFVTDEEIDTGWIIGLKFF